MLEVGWSEILVIALILIIVVGPKDLPPMLRTFGRMAARLRGMANEFKGQFDEALREADLDDVRKGLNEVNKLNPTNSLRDAINPIRQLGQDIKADLRKASDMSTPAATVTTEAVVAAEDTAAVPGVDDKPVGDAVEVKPAETAAAPAAAPVVQAPVVAPVVEKAAEPAQVSQPVVSKPAEAVASAPAVATSAEPKARKAARSKDVASPDEAAARKPASRKKSAAVPQAEANVAAVDGAKPKKAAPRKKTEKAGDA